jgi:hypothetical protein
MFHQPAPMRAVGAIELTLWTQHRFDSRNSNSFHGLLV